MKRYISPPIGFKKLGHGVITRLNKQNKKTYIWLLEFLESNYDYDFYVTEQNSRLYITDESSLKKLFRDSEYIYTLEEDGDYLGIILVWKSLGGGKKRYYVKICAVSENVAKKLLTVVLWNFPDDLYIKIKKDNKYLSVFKSKGFKFKGGRGVQILLHRKSTVDISKNKKEYKEEK